MSLMGSGHDSKKMGSGLDMGHPCYHVFLMGARYYRLELEGFDIPTFGYCLIQVI